MPRRLTEARLARRQARLAELVARGRVPHATWYGTALRLRRVRLHWLVRTLYLEGAAMLGIVLYLADAASAWVILTLPASIAVSVKVYDTVLDATVPPPER